MELLCLHNYTRNGSNSGGLLNTTIAWIEPMEGSVTVADSITVPLSPDLTVDCFDCFAVCMWLKQKHYNAQILLFELCWKSETSLLKKNKKKTQSPPKHARYYFCFLLSHPLVFEWLIQWVCVWMCTCRVSFHQQALELSGPSAVQACWNVMVLILYFSVLLQGIWKDLIYVFVICNLYEKKEHVCVMH